MSEMTKPDTITLRRDAVKELAEAVLYDLTVDTRWRNGGPDVAVARHRIEAAIIAAGVEVCCPHPESDHAYGGEDVCAGCCRDGVGLRARHRYAAPLPASAGTEERVCGAINPDTGTVCVVPPHRPEVHHIGRGEVWHSPIPDAPKPADPIEHDLLANPPYESPLGIDAYRHGFRDGQRHAPIAPPNLATDATEADHDASDAPAPKVERCAAVFDGETCGAPRSDARHVCLDTRLHRLCLSCHNFVPPAPVAQATEPPPSPEGGHACSLGERCSDAMMCCRRIAHAAGAWEKAKAALHSFVDQGGYDHWEDVVHWSNEAAREEREGRPHFGHDSPTADASPAAPPVSEGEGWSDSDLIEHFTTIRVHHPDDEHLCIDGIGHDWIENHFDELCGLLRRAAPTLDLMSTTPCVDCASTKDQHCEGRLDGSHDACMLDHSHPYRAEPRREIACVDVQEDPETSQWRAVLSVCDITLWHEEGFHGDADHIGEMKQAAWEINARINHSAAPPLDAGKTHSWVQAWHSPDAPDWSTWEREAIADHFYSEGTRYSPDNVRAVPLDAQALAEGYDGDFDPDGSGAIETKANMRAIIERAAGRK